MTMTLTREDTRSSRQIIEEAEAIIEQRVILALEDFLNRNKANISNLDKLYLFDQLHHAPGLNHFVVSAHHSKTYVAEYALSGDNHNILGHLGSDYHGFPDWLIMVTDEATGEIKVVPACIECSAAPATCTWGNSSKLVACKDCY